MIVYVEKSPKVQQSNLLALISNYSKITRYQVNIQKSVAFLAMKNWNLKLKSFFFISTKKRGEGGKRQAYRYKLNKKCKIYTKKTTKLMKEIKI